MPFVGPQYTQVPHFKIIINGSELPINVETKIVKIEVDHCVNLPSMFVLKLAGLSSPNHISELIDGSEMFSVGNVIEIKMGYAINLETLFIGEITGIEPDFLFDRPLSLSIRGYDRGHRLLRGRKTRTFKQEKDSGIAEKIANELGLTPEVEDTQVVHEYVIQANQTDMEFLQGRGKRIHYEVAVEDKALFFRQIKNTESETLKITFDDDLLEFYPRVSTLRQISGVEIAGWNFKNKKEIIGSATIGDEVSKMGGENSGAEIADNFFDTSTGFVDDRPVATQPEADQIAKARFNNVALALINGEGLCFGRTDLRAGKVIKIDGLGERLSGRYYVTNSIHSYTSERGYYTNFSVRRNAS